MNLTNPTCDELRATNSGPTETKSLMTSQWTRSAPSLVAVIFSFSLLAAVSTHAAVITVDESHFLGGQNDGPAWSASMNNSNAFLKDNSGALFADLTGTVVDYDFSNSPGYKGSANIITNIPDAGPGGRMSLDLWTETMDPVNDSAIATAGDNGNPGSGTIDISTMSGGTVWILSGDWSGTISVNATITDTDGQLADVVMTTFDKPNSDGLRGFHYAFKMNFSDAGDYEQISWTATGGYFTGVVVTSEPVPEPASMAMGLMGLSLIVGRRRRTDRS
jgi:MYXO-CTERM domain-containing protein